MLAGTLKPDAGTVLIEEPAAPAWGDPVASEAAGIGAVLREFTTIPDLTVAQTCFCVERLVATGSSARDGRLRRPSACSTN